MPTRLSKIRKDQIVSLYTQAPFPTVHKVAEILNLNPDSIYSAGQGDPEWWHAVKGLRERNQAAHIEAIRRQAVSELNELLPAAVDSLKTHLKAEWVMRHPLIAADARKTVLKYAVPEPSQALDVTIHQPADLGGLSDDELDNLERLATRLTGSGPDQG